MAEPHRFPVQIYYEDTDHSGLVYHANYLRYFERAREHVLGREELARLYRESGVGFVVYKIELSFKEGAVFGDELEIRTLVEIKSEYRALFHQDVYRVGGTTPLVEGEVHLVAVDKANKLTRLPAHVIALAKDRWGVVPKADGN